MEANPERALIPRPSRELTAPQVAPYRILDEIVETSLAHAKYLFNEKSTSAVRLPIPNAVRRVSGSYDYTGYEPLESVGCDGFINEKGEVAIHPEWDFAHPFRQNFSLVCRDGKYGFIDRNGYLAIPLKWDFAYDFYDGLASIWEGSERGFIDQDGDIAFRSKGHPTYHRFSEGRLQVVKMGKRLLHGFVGRKGEVISEIQWDGAGSFSEGYAAVEKEDKWGFIDLSGDVIIKPDWDFAEPFQEGLAAVRRNGKAGFINRIGEISIPLRWSDVGNFSEGLAYVDIDIGGETQCGFLNKAGELIVEPSYQWTCPFSEGLGCIQKNWKRGFLNRSGEMAIALDFDFASTFFGGMAFVQLEEKWGFIDREGKVVVPFQWDAAISYRVASNSAVYRQLIREISLNRALVVWLDQKLNVIWEREVDIQESDMGEYSSWHLTEISEAV